MAMLNFNMFGGNPYSGVPVDQMTPVPAMQRKGGFMDRLNGVMNPYGLLGEEGDMVKQQGLLGLASGLLAASGPSTQRVSLGQALGQGLQGMQKGQQGAFQNAMLGREMGLKSALANQKKPPEMRTVTRGNKEVQEEFNPTTGQWTPIGEGPRWNPNPSTVVNNNMEGAFKVPPGYMLKDPSNIQAGVTPIPGGPADQVSADAASKAQMLRTAKDQIPLVRKLIFSEEGSPNYKNIGLANTMSGGIPHTTGRQLASAMEVGIQAITRSETGAAMPKDEVDNTRRRFQPSVMDDDKTVKLKIDMYEDFINGNLKLLDPSGRFDSKRFESEFQRRKQGISAPEQTNNDDPLGLRQ